jgi:23S rRNA maturation mini-RNase III
MENNKDEGITAKKVHDLFSRNGSKPAFSIKVNFDSQDDAVPKYLKWLDKSEKDSRRRAKNSKKMIRIKNGK